MCLIIAFVLGILAFNAFAAGNLSLGTGAIAGSLFFIALMVRNILRTRQERAERNKPKEDNE